MVIADAAHHAIVWMHQCLHEISQIGVKSEIFPPTETNGNLAWAFNSAIRSTNRTNIAAGVRFMRPRDNLWSP